MTVCVYVCESMFAFVYSYVCLCLHQSMCMCMCLSVRVSASDPGRAKGEALFPVTWIFYGSATHTFLPRGTGGTSKGVCVRREKGGRSEAEARIMSLGCGGDGDDGCGYQGRHK